MKRLLFLIAFLPLSLAYSNVINSSTDFNLLFYLASGDNVYDNQTNSSFIGVWTKINSIQNLNYSESWYNPFVNASCQAPAFPKINSVVPLNFSGVYLNPPYNLTVTCPALSVFNHTDVYLTNGNKDNYTPPVLAWNCSNANETVYAPPTLHANEIAEIEPGAYLNYTDVGSTYYCKPNAFDLVTKTLEGGENYVDSDRNVDITCVNNAETVDYSNQSINLACGVVFTEPRIGLILNAPACNVVNTSETLQTFVESKLENCMNKINIKQSSGDTIALCIDNLSAFCSSQEILDGNMVGCFQRYTQGQTNDNDNLRKQVLDLSTKLQAWQDSSKIVAENKKDLEDKATTILLYIAVGLILATAFKFYVERKSVRTTQTSIQEK